MQFIQNLTRFHPRGSTDIQKPLEYFKEFGLFTNENSHHILLTDGFPIWVLHTSARFTK